MNQQRADEIYAAHLASGHGDWDRQRIETFLTDGEKKAVMSQWDKIATVPGGGNSCWADAFFTLMSPDKLPPYMVQRCRTIHHLLAQQGTLHFHKAAEPRLISPESETMA